MNVCGRASRTGAHGASRTDRYAEAGRKGSLAAVHDLWRADSSQADQAGQHLFSRLQRRAEPAQKQGILPENIKFKPEAPSKCEFCGKDFIQNRRNHRFCNIRCQEAHSRAVKRGEAANTGMTPGMANRSYGTGVCVICGEQYIKRSARQLTCSDWCRKVHVDKRRKEGKC